MADEQEVNADLSAHVIMHGNDMAWEETGVPGLTCKRFELVLDPRKGRETSLYKFDAGVGLPEFPLDERTEIMVLDGTVSDGQGSYDICWIRPIPRSIRPWSGRPWHSSARWA